MTELLAHSRLGASGAKRWMTCPGSIRETQHMEDTSSVFAREGTAAHELAETCLLLECDGKDRLGDEIQVEDDVFIVDAEMANAVQVYLDVVRAEVAKDEANVLEVEVRFHTPALFEECYGTNDTSVYQPKARRQVVIDYKHGKGTPVEVEMNPQNLYYGIGSLMNHSDRRVDEIELVIVQPRCPHPDGPVRRFTISAMELMDWSADLVEAAAATRELDAPLVAGDHCKFCLAAGTCRELQSTALDLAQAEFSPSGDMTLTKPSELSPTNLARLLEGAHIIKGWLKQVEAFAHSEAEHGRPPTGWKLVRKKANRKWQDETAAQMFLKGLGFDEDETLTDPKIKSPAQIETLVKGHNFKEGEKEEFYELIVKPEGGATLALESDKRPAIRPEAETEFDPVKEET